MASSIRITLPLPPALLSPNARPRHWSQKSKVVKAYRRLACWLTLAAGGKGKRWPRAIATASFFWPTHRLRDVGNAEASLKAAFDGIVDAGLLVDDRAEVLTHRPSSFAVDRKNPRVVIEIEQCRKR